MLVASFWYSVVAAALLGSIGYNNDETDDDKFCSKKERRISVRNESLNSNYYLSS
jgi:hypothetical protein